MRIVVSFDPEDGTGTMIKSCDLSLYHSVEPDTVWFEYIKMMRELIHSWKWRKARKPMWDDTVKRHAWKAEANEWTKPIDDMIAARKDLVDSIDMRESNFGYGDHREWPRDVRVGWHIWAKQPIEECDCNELP